MKQQVFLKTREDGVDIWRTYSDQGLVIQNTITKEIFDIADDPYEMLPFRPYEELDILIEDYFSPSVEEDEIEEED